ncbi:hypothetical protein KA005_56250 [bacterium]|nr:hypothetical protein [bacterium]
MVGKPQTLSKGQEDDVIRILRKKLLTWTLIGFTILAGLTGASLWGIMKRAETKMEILVSKQFEEPRIQEVVRQVAAERATTLMTEQMTPEVTKFKADVADQLKELHSLVTKTRELESESRKHERSIQAVLGGLQISFKQSQEANKGLARIKHDIVEMQKCIATMRYYEMIGRNTIPNPYGKEMLASLNKLVAIAIPDPVERSKFVAELQALQEVKK